MGLAVGGAVGCGDSGGGDTTGSDGGGTPGVDGGQGGGSPDAGGAPPPQDAALPPPMGDGGASGRTFDGGSDPARNMISASGLCERFASLQCAAEQSCCSSPGRNFEACKTAQVAICRDQGHLDVAAGVAAAGFDAAKAKAAFERFEALATVCDPAVTAWVLAVPSGFRGVFAGTLEANASCLPPLDVILAADEGKAAGYALACKNPETTACLPKTATTWTCDPRGGASAQCFTDANCAGETYCDNPNPSIAALSEVHACKARKALGEACVGTGECQSLVCVAGKCAPLSADGAYCLGR